MGNVIRLILVNAALHLYLTVAVWLLSVYYLAEQMVCRGCGAVLHKYVLHVNCISTTHVYCICTTYILHVYYICVLHICYLCITHILRVNYIYTTCGIPIYNFICTTEILHVYYMYTSTGCVIHVY